jgi:hypothetical protein
MWEPRRLTPLLASMACYRDSFTFTDYDVVGRPGQLSNPPALPSSLPPAFLHSENHLHHPKTCALDISQISVGFSFKLEQKHHVHSLFRVFITHFRDSCFAVLPFSLSDSKAAWMYNFVLRKFIKFEFQVQLYEKILIKPKSARRNLLQTFDVKFHLNQQRRLGNGT